MQIISSGLQHQLRILKKPLGSRRIGPQSIHRGVLIRLLINDAVILLCDFLSEKLRRRGKNNEREG
jgi:hypothetical protein